MEGQREGGREGQGKAACRRQETCWPKTRFSGPLPRPLPAHHLRVRERVSVHACASAGARYTCGHVMRYVIRHTCGVRVLMRAWSSRTSERRGGPTPSDPT